MSGLNLPEKEDGKKMGFDGEKQHKVIHRAEMSVEAWLESARHLPRLQHN